MRFPFGGLDFFHYLCNMQTNILLLIILCHIIDDFVLQPISLSKLKQEKWWKKQEGYKELYENDFRAALAIHSMSWSIVVLLPIIMLSTASEMAIFVTFLLNTVIHYIVDDLKAN